LPHMLMKLSDEINSKLIHISTDCVFSGEKTTPYKELDFKDGKDTYAKTKGLGEIINDRHLTLRTSVIGPELKSNGEELFHWFMNQRIEINGFTKAIWSGVTTLVLAKAVNWAIENNVKGLYHITNNKSIDKYSLLQLIKHSTGKDIMINPFDGKEIYKNFIDTREELSFKIPDYKEMISEMVEMILSNRKLYQQYLIK
jgi:dTDP-4-dehydrorhamnose reductase